MKHFVFTPLNNINNVVAQIKDKFFNVHILKIILFTGTAAFILFTGSSKDKSRVQKVTFEPFTDREIRENDPIYKLIYKDWNKSFECK